MGAIRLQTPERWRLTPHSSVWPGGSQPHYFAISPNIPHKGYYAVFRIKGRMSAYTLQGYTINKKILCIQDGYVNEKGN